MNQGIFKNTSGMTLVELLIALGISSFFILGLYGIFVSQDRMFKSQSLINEVQYNGREALINLTTAIRGAGFGIHPWLAFNFCGNPPCRDLACDNVGCSAGPNLSDEIIFYSRNPDRRTWGTVVAGQATTTQMKVSVNYNNYVVRKGQILLVVCNEALDTERREDDTAYVVNLNTATNQGGFVNITFDNSGSIPPEFRQGSKLTPTSCFNNGSAGVYFVDRYHYYINSTADPQHPYLMLDTGTDINGDGNVNSDDHIPVAGDIESIQFVYIMNNGTELGESLGVAEEPDPSLPSPDLTDTYDSPSRNNNNPANIRFVRISILARSANPNPDWRLPDGTFGRCVNYPDRCRERVENFIGSDPNANADGFVRVLFQQTVPVWNMRATAVIYEPLT